MDNTPLDGAALASSSSPSASASGMDDADDFPTDILNGKSFHARGYSTVRVYDSDFKPTDNWREVYPNQFVHRACRGPLLIPEGGKTVLLDRAKYRPNRAREERVARLAGLQNLIKHIALPTGLRLPLQGLLVARDVEDCRSQPVAGFGHNIDLGLTPAHVRLVQGVRKGVANYDVECMFGPLNETADGMPRQMYYATDARYAVDGSPEDIATMMARALAATLKFAFELGCRQELDPHRRVQYLAVAKIRTSTACQYVFDVRMPIADGRLEFTALSGGDVLQPVRVVPFTR